MKRYEIRQAGGPVPLRGDVAGTPWAAADAARVDVYPWYESGAKQATTMRVLYDRENLYWQALCEDRHISCDPRGLNDGVCLDSCVELFAIPEPDFGPHYFNLEINACGALLMAYGQGWPRPVVTPAQAERIQIVTSVPAPTKDESPADDGWWLAVKLPFALLSELAGRPIAPKRGTTWRANFYRCGGKTDPQFASWNDIKCPGPNFHCPAEFGEAVFM